MTCVDGDVRPYSLTHHFRKSCCNLAAPKSCTLEPEIILEHFIFTVSEIIELTLFSPFISWNEGVKWTVCVTNQDRGEWSVMPCCCSFPVLSRSSLLIDVWHCIETCLQEFLAFFDICTFLCRKQTRLSSSIGWLVFKRHFSKIGCIMPGPYDI